MVNWEGLLVKVNDLVVLVTPAEGSGFNEVGKKQAGKTDYLVGKIKAGGVGVYGQIPMPAQSLPDADAKQIAEWISKGASK